MGDQPRKGPKPGVVFDIHIRKMAWRNATAARDRLTTPAVVERCEGYIHLSRDAHDLHFLRVTLHDGAASHVYDLDGDDLFSAILEVEARKKEQKQRHYILVEHLDEDGGTRRELKLPVSGDNRVRIRYMLPDDQKRQEMTSLGLFALLDGHDVL